MPTATRRRAKSGQGVDDRNLPAVIDAIQGEVVDQAPILELELRIKEGLREAKGGLWKAAEALYEFDARQGWSVLGYDNLSKWLEDPGIDMTRGTYYRLKNTWEKLAVGKGIPRAQLEAVDMSKADLVADQIVEGRVRPATALKDAAELTANELRVKYQKPKRGRPPKGEEPAQHSPSTALKAASELPWEWVEQAVSGRSPIALREARLKEALTALLAWRDEFVVHSSD